MEKGGNFNTYMPQLDTFLVAFVVDVMRCAFFTFTMIKPDPIMKSGDWIIFNLIHEDMLEGTATYFALSAWV